MDGHYRASPGTMAQRVDSPPQGSQSPGCSQSLALTWGSLKAHMHTEPAVSSHGVLLIIVLTVPTGVSTNLPLSLPQPDLSEWRARSYRVTAHSGSLAPLAVSGGTYFLC